MGTVPAKKLQLQQAEKQELPQQGGGGQDEAGGTVPDTRESRPLLQPRTATATVLFRAKKKNPLKKGKLKIYKSCSCYSCSFSADSSTKVAELTYNPPLF